MPQTTKSKISESWFVFLIKATLYPLVFGIAVSSFASTSTAIMVALAALLGSLLAPWMVRTRFKKWPILLLGPLMVLLGLFLDYILTQPTFFATTLGVETTITLSEWFRLGLFAFGFAFLLRALALYFPALNILEAMVAVAFFVWLFAGHRHFAFHQPRALSDFSWEIGLNPLLLWLIVGALLLVASTLLLLQNKKVGRSFLQIFLILLIGGLSFYLFKDKNINLAERDNPFGLFGNDPDSMKRGQKGEGTNSGQGEQQNQSGANQTPQGEAGPGQSQPATGQNAQNQNQGQNNQQKGDQKDKQGNKNQLDEMPFNNNYSSGNKNQPVAVVKFLDEYVPPSEYYYFRQTAFSRFNGHRLVQSVADEDIFPNLSSVEQTVKLPYFDSVAFKKVSSQVFLMSDPTKPFALANPQRVKKIANPNTAYFKGVYEADSFSLSRDYEAMFNDDKLPSWDPEKLKKYLELPADPRYKKLAESLLPQIKPDYRDNPLVRMLAISYYLGKTGYYSLQSDHASAEDPTASFLFGNKTGYCVHFAHAAVYLARSLGIPARVGAGYAVAASRRGRSEYLAIMERDAHAWPELYIEPYGWVIVDVPVQNYLDPPLPEPSPDLQNKLGQIADKDENPWEQDREPSRLAEYWQSFVNGLKLLLKYALLVLIPLLFLTVLLGYFYKFWRLWFWNQGQVSDRLRKGYRSLLDVLQLNGLQRHFGETREDFARRVSLLTPSFVGLSWNFLEQRLGKATLMNESELQAQVKTVKSELRNKKKDWRFFVRLLHPFSWWKVR